MISPTRTPVPPGRRPGAPDDAAPFVLKRLFGGRVINHGAGMIHVHAASAVERGSDLTVSVEVNWPMVLAKAVAHLYLIADGNRPPLIARIPLMPDVVPPHVCVKVRLRAGGYLRAVVECGDGTLLQVAHWVSVLPAES